MKEFSTEVSDLLNEVYLVYGQFSASKLRNMTHSEPPWINTGTTKVISHKMMKDYFKTLLN